MSELKYDEPAERFAPIVEKSLYAGATAVMVPSETGCWVHYVEYCERIANIKSEADKVIAEKDAEIRRLKNSIAPKQSDKTIQERLNEVCEKHGVSTLQDLDWAFCESEKRHAKDCIEAVSIIRHSNHKRCLAMAQWCMDAECKTEKDADFLVRWEHRWLALAEEPTWAKFLQLIRKEAK